jgi:hypothetical protein
MPADPGSELRSILENLFAENTRIYNEAGLQINLEMKLKDCDPELPMTFLPPKYPPKTPPSDALEDFAPLKINPEGIDPCKPRACLDLLWSTDAGNFAIELKFVRERKSDTYGYEFLKDLHRLERLSAVRGHESIEEQRFAVFVTCEQVYWEGRRPEPEPFWISEAMTRPSNYWVQYDQQSLKTRWVDYPPFYLANSYNFQWRDLSDGFRYLMVEVRPQGSDLNP